MSIGVLDDGLSQVSSPTITLDDKDFSVIIFRYTHALTFLRKQGNLPDSKLAMCMKELRALKLKDLEWYLNKAANDCDCAPIG